MGLAEWWRSQTNEWERRIFMRLWEVSLNEKELENCNFLILYIFSIYIYTLIAKSWYAKKLTSL